jgi:hypothetical protein
MNVVVLARGSQDRRADVAAEREGIAGLFARRPIERAGA